MNCPNCGANLNPGDVFCQACGARVANGSSSRLAGNNKMYCPVCGAANSPSMEFCTTCGNLLIADPNQGQSPDSQASQEAQAPTPPQPTIQETQPSIPQPSIPQPTIPQPSIPKPSIPQPIPTQPTDPQMTQPMIPQPMIPQPVDPQMTQPMIPQPVDPQMTQPMQPPASVASTSPLDDTAESRAVNVADASGANVSPYEQAQPEKKGATSAIVIGLIIGIALLGVFVTMKPSQSKSSSSTSGLAIGSETYTGVQIDSANSSIVSNLINGGHMAVGPDGLFYYAAPIDGTSWNTASINRSGVDGARTSTLYQGPSGTLNLWHITVTEDWVVCNQELENSASVVAVPTDGGSATTIDSCDPWTLCMVQNGVAYYLKNGTLMRCDLATMNPEALNSIGSDYLWRLYGEVGIKFREENATEISVFKVGKTSSNGSTVKAPSGYIVKNAFFVAQEQIAVLLREKSGSACKVEIVDLSSDVRTDLWEDGNGWNTVRMCAHDNGVIITTTNNDGAYVIERIDYSGETQRLLTTSKGDGQVVYTNCWGDKVFYGLIDETNGNNCSIYMVSLQGGTPSIVVG